MFYRKIISFAAVAILAVATSATGFANSSASSFSSDENTDKSAATRPRLAAPLNLAILIQDDLTSQVSNELGVTRDFIRSLPRGSQVMVGYITMGSLQVRQSFTTDLDKAANSLRIVRSSTDASAYNPYVEVVEALKSFNNLKGPNAILLISDGLDTSHGFDATSSGHTIDIDRAIKRANEYEVAVYTFYAPSVGLTSRSHLAASYGQSSLNRLADETGGRAFFQGSTGFVTFDSYFEHLKQTLNEYARAS